MPWTMRVSTPGNNALTDTVIDHYSIYADSDNVLIKEHSRGTTAVANSTTGTITHNIGYIPFYLVYCEISLGRYRLSTFHDFFGASWKMSVNDNTLLIRNLHGTAGTNVRYYLFYDELNT